MNPEEKQLLEKALKLSEENNDILRRIEKRAKWSMIWGFIKLAIIVIPLVLGYLYLEPQIKEAADNYSSMKELLGF